MTNRSDRQQRHSLMSLISVAKQASALNECAAVLTLFGMGGGAPGAPPWKVFKMLNFDVVMTPTMSRNIFGVIWKFWKKSFFWVILESLLQLKRILDHFKSWNYPILCVWWVTKSFELIKVPEVCFLGGGSSSPPSCQMHQKKAYVK